MMQMPVWLLLVMLCVISPALLASNIFKAMIREKDFVKILPS
jgi:hypothetical protein